MFTKTFDSRTYFKNLLGTTKSGNHPQLVILHFSSERSKYVATKKIHPKQEMISLPDGRLEVRITVELNRELEARILEFGKDVVVVAPSELREQIRDILWQAFSQYDAFKELS